MLAPEEMKMLKSFATLICVSAAMLFCQIAFPASPLTQPLAEAAAREVRSSHPPGCLDAWPVEQNLEGRLLGIVLGAFPEENPPVPARSFLFLSLDDPISVCASAPNHFPAYEAVTRIKLINLSLSDFLYVMRTWGSDEIRIMSTLGTAETIGQEPGPVIFNSANFKFCWRSVLKAMRPADSATNGGASAWTCMNSGAWFHQLPGPHLP